MKTKALKTTTFLIMMVLLSSVCLAVEVYSGTFREETNVDVGGKVLNARYYDATDKISLNIVDESKYILVNRGECVTSGQWEYCFDSATEEDEEIVKNGQTLLNTYFVIGMTVNKQAPVIDISLVTASDEISVDTNFEVTITMTNSGDLDASNINFELKVPEGLQIVSSGMTLFGDKLLWTESISKGKSKEKKATFKAKDFGEYTLEAKAEYQAAGTSTTSEESLDVEAKLPYTINTSISLALAGQNEASTYTITITNDDASSKLQINKFEIKIPSSIDVKSVPTGFSVMSGVLSGTAQIDAGQTKQFAVKIQSGKKGDYQLKT
ncbi:MAG: hypothetical protein KJ574_03125, partial [Nanoarchaeota archaeon]|nr:hypothetical protein [Nanoarchaeota archaeon]